ncbi:hypothetical protein B7R22_08730 [Subtercola boreus]|uniref:Uncharacterized protein n=1 Tax=Subtercola boreus TaxID=120213 RepID=A0A3E0VY18_9MICO|nr:hypothetical protein B7R22_08730 [Subtercola boreus]
MRATPPAPPLRHPCAPPLPSPPLPAPPVRHPRSQLERSKGRKSLQNSRERAVWVPSTATPRRYSAPLLRAATPRRGQSAGVIWPTTP